MYKKLNITENHLQVLSLFTKGFNKEYYIREVKKLLNISPRTSQLMLNDLEKKTVLESKIKGKIKTYKLKTSENAKEYVILTEIYKRVLFLENNLLIKEIISKIKPYIDGIGIIFGSYAKGIQKKDSDLDIFIIGDYNEKEVNKISNLYGINLSVKKYTLKIFKDNVQKDTLIREVLDNHIIFLGTDKFIDLVIG